MLNISHLIAFIFLLLANSTGHFSPHKNLSFFYTSNYDCVHSLKHLVDSNNWIDEKQSYIMKKNSNQKTSVQLFLTLRWFLHYSRPCFKIIMTEHAYNALNPWFSIKGNISIRIIYSFKFKKEAYSLKKNVMLMQTKTQNYTTWRSYFPPEIKNTGKSV